MSSPDSMQLEALRELVNVGCGHAATALSRLMGNRRVQITLPWAGTADASAAALRMGGMDSPVVALYFRTVVGLRSSLLLVLPEGDARRLCHLLLGQEPGLQLDELQRSALAETGNIVASACLNAVGRLTGQTLIPSVPNLKECRISELMEELRRQKESGDGSALLLEARFFTPSEPRISGWVLMAPDSADVDGLLRRLGAGSGEMRSG